LVTALALVNRTFYLAVSPFLHQTLKLGHPHPVEPLLADEFSRASSRHTHVRSLIVECNEKCAERVAKGAEEDVECVETIDVFYNALLSALPNMSRLRCFR
jgi:hypothetical protein